MTKSTKRVCVATAVAAFHLPSIAGAAAPSDLAQLDFFEKKIRPVLAKECYECHSADAKKLKGGLQVDTAEGLLKGGDTGPAIVPRNPAKSLLLITMRHEDKDPDLAMPPKKERLSDEVLADFEKWIRMGAPDPRDGKVSRTLAWDEETAKKHWSFQKITAPPVPKPADPKNFIRNPIDNFVLAKLTEKNLQPSPQADKHALIRRMTFDLIGLPPTPDEVEAFLADKSPNAYEKVVDRLLASPRYGERWARHWLDIARYADTSGDRQAGNRRNPLFPNAWTYRDYVIEAFNKDLPYDQFIIEQLAADRLPDSKTDKSKLAALGFITVGKRFMGNENDIIDDRIDVVTKGLMGITGSCARCHDHKFDPIPTKDYYSLYGVFSSSQEVVDGLPIGDPDANPLYKDFEAAVAKVEVEADTFADGEAARLVSGMLEKTGDYMLAAHDAKPLKGSVKKNDNFRIIARDRGLKAEIAAIWLDRLKGIESASKDDAVFGPWAKFAAIPASEFAQSAPALAQEIAASPTVTPLLAKAFAAKAPGTLKDVADIYTESFGKLHSAMKLESFLGYRTGGRSRFNVAQTRNALPDADLEALRQKVYGEDSLMLPDEQNMARALGVQFTNQISAVRGKILNLQLTHPGAPVKAMAMTDRDKPRDAVVLIRGEAQNRGPVVPRQFPALLTSGERKPFTDGSGRLEMAKLIASRDNPLTARVIANRIWQWHFGQAIVRTVSDFGTRSEPPTHPELLEWLAAWTMDNGWSLKKLNKLIVMSAAYQQDSRPREAAMKADPTNQWLWRANIQRLDFEQVRDSLLAISGKLDLTMGGQPFAMASGSATTKNRYATAELSTTKGTNRRSVYSFINRAALPEMLNTFDFANPDMSTGERIMTTVPQQALFMMNSPFLIEQVKNILARPDFPTAGSDADRVRFIFRAAFQRPPTKEELAIAEQFLASETPKPSASETPGLAIGQADALEDKVRKKTGGQFQPLNPLERYTQIILLTNEMIFLN